MAKAWSCTLLLGVLVSGLGVVSSSTPAAAVSDPGPIKDVATGERSSCLVSADDRIFCWGSGFSGALGNGGSSDAPTPVEVTTAGTPLAGKVIADVEVGGDRACARTTDGVLACWGDGEFDVLGTGTTADSPIPVAPKTTGTPFAGKAWAQVTVGSGHTCAVTTEGIAACWGSGGNGQLGTGGTHATVPTAVTTAGTALAGKAIAELSAGQAHTCARATDGTVACWGFNGRGQLGNGGTSDVASPVAVVTAATPLEGKTVVQIATGSFHSCARTSDGTVACWGHNQYGSLGVGSTADSSKPVAVVTAGTPLAAKVVAQIEAGTYHSCAVAVDGTLACWGRNNHGVLGNGSIADSTLPAAVTTAGTPLAGATVVQISARFDTACARTTTGSVACWGGNLYGQRGDGTSGIALKGAAAVRGSLSDLAVGQVVVGSDFACALAGGAVHCWGANSRGQLGDGGSADRAHPAAVVTAGSPLAGKVVTRVDAESQRACALTSDGVLACWGASGGSSLRAPTSFATGALAGKSIKGFALGSGHVCALTTDGVVACWGSNADGQLGNGTTTTSTSTPVQLVTAGTVLAGKTIVAIRAGGTRTCALTADAVLACWGNGDFGGLGIGADHADKTTPVAVATAGTPLAGKSLDALELGTYHTCALASDGQVACWGYNAYGQLGVGDFTNHDVPTALKVTGTPLAAAFVNSIRPGNTTTCFTTSGGEAACTGGDDFSTTYWMLGTGASVLRSNVAVLVERSGTALTTGKVVEAAPAGTFACARTSAGVVVCWGSNVSGRFGNGAMAYSTVPGALAWDELPRTVPGPPVILAVTPGDGEATVTWSPPSTDGGSAVREYLVTPYAGGVAQGPPISAGIATSKVVTGLTNGTAYTFRVAAVNGVGTSSNSAASQPVTPGAPVVAPGAPTIGTVVAGDGQVSVSWSAPASDGGSAITGYVVTPYVGGVAQTPVPSSGTATSKVVTGLTNGTAYTFKVAAVNGVGTGPQSSASASATPLPPYAPFASWAALVQRLHTDLTNAAPSAAALSTWTTALGDGTQTKGDLVQALRGSTDNTSKVDPTVRLYRALLGRAPDAGGLKFWVARRRTGTWSLVRMADYFASSSEFKRKYGALTNEQFVRRIYTDVLGRTADEAGVTYWTRQLDLKRRTRGSVMVGFSESNEYKTKQRENTDVAVAYIFLLGRAPTSAETTDWVTREKAGTTQAALARELLDSAGYADHITG